jgi:anti-sigma regulatory factor (Ser/Thr protein kinase)
MEPILFEKELFIPSTIEGLNKCLALIEEIGTLFVLSLDTLFRLHTAIVEIVENAFIHGNKGVRELDVRIYISVSLLEIFIEVEDRGDGFDINKISSSIIYKSLHKEGGRGIFFVKMLSASIYTAGKGNIIRIIIKR